MLPCCVNFQCVYFVGFFCEDYWYFGIVIAFRIADYNRLACRTTLPNFRGLGGGQFGLLHRSHRKLLIRGENWLLICAYRQYFYTKSCPLRVYEKTINGVQLEEFSNNTGTIHWFFFQMLHFPLKKSTFNKISNVSRYVHSGDLDTLFFLLNLMLFIGKWSIFVNFKWAMICAYFPPVINMFIENLD